MEDNKQKKQMKRMSERSIKRVVQQYFFTDEGKTKTVNELLTINALALILGFASKEELLAFEGTEGEMREIKKALTYLEMLLERALFFKDSYQAARFALVSQFGWKEKNDEKSDFRVTIIDDIDGEKELG